MLILDIWRCKKNITHCHTHDRAAGYLEFERLELDGFYQLIMMFLPEEIKLKGQRTYRSITIEGEELEFSGGFTICIQKFIKGIDGKDMA